VCFQILAPSWFKKVLQETAVSQCVALCVPQTHRSILCLHKECRSDCAWCQSGSQRTLDESAGPGPAAAAAPQQLLQADVWVLQSMHDSWLVHRHCACSMLTAAPADDNISGGAWLFTCHADVCWTRWQLQVLQAGDCNKFLLVGAATACPAWPW
jgi:hypothetical protein